MLATGCRLQLLAKFADENVDDLEFGFDGFTGTAGITVSGSDDRLVTAGGLQRLLALSRSAHFSKFGGKVRRGVLRWHGSHGVSLGLFFRPHPERPQPQRIELDKALRVFLVVSAFVVFKRDQRWRIQ